MITMQYDRYGTYWRVSVYRNGTRTTRAFSIRKHGETEARRLAEEAEAEMLREAGEMTTAEYDRRYGGQGAPSATERYRPALTSQFQLWNPRKEKP